MCVCDEQLGACLLEMTGDVTGGGRCLYRNQGDSGARRECSEVCDGILDLFIPQS